MSDDEIATRTAQDGSGRENADAPDAEHALDVAAVLAALREADRDPVTGQFKAGHVRNLTHGLRTPRLWAASPLREVLAEREAGVLADLGGDGNLSRVERPLVREYARLDVLVEAAGELQSHELRGVPRPEAGNQCFNPVEYRHGFPFLEVGLSSLSADRSATPWRA